MVIFVQYHVPKEYFVKHKKEFKKILHKTPFQVAVLKFEKGMPTKEIAEKYNFKELQIHEILSFVCRKLREGGYKTRFI